MLAQKRHKTGDAHCPRASRMYNWYVASASKLAQVILKAKAPVGVVEVPENFRSLPLHEPPWFLCRCHNGPSRCMCSTNEFNFPDDAYCYPCTRFDSRGECCCECDGCDPRACNQASCISKPVVTLNKLRCYQN